MKKRTKLLTLARGEKAEVKGVNPVLMRSSTILFDSHATWSKYKKLRQEERVLSYGARGVSTNFELDRLISELEGGYRTFLFPTGLAALAMVLLNYAKSDAHFLITDGIYDPVREICDLFLSKIGVEVEFLQADASDLEEKIKPNTRLILCESPGSILYEIIDIPKLCQIAHQHNIPVAIDNTYSSGYLFNPLKHGVDISVIAATKYLCGHSDVVMGAVVVNQKEWKNFQELPYVFGLTTSPDDCYLVLRGMRTLDVRMREHERNADAIVAFFQTRKEIKTIFYPKLKTHPNHEIFLRDFSGTNGMVTIEFDKKYSKAAVIACLDSLELFGIGASWGGYESLVSYTHIPRTQSDWSKRGAFARFHIGLEDANDLIDDLARAFDRLKG